MSIEKISRVKELKVKENNIHVSEESLKLKDEIGSELFELINSIWNEKTLNFYRDLIKKSSEFKREKDLVHEDFIKGMDFYAQTYLNEISEQIKKDPRILSAFTNNKELLDKVIKYEVSTIIDKAKYI